MANIIPLPNFQFQGAPSPAGTAGYNLAGSIDDLFSQYQKAQQSKALVNQYGLQNQALQNQLSTQPQLLQSQLQGSQDQVAMGQANDRIALGGLTPQRFNAGIDAAQSFYAQPQNQAQPGGQFLSPQPSSDQPQAAQQAPGDAGTAFHVMQLHLMAQGLSAQEAQAQLANTLAQASEHQAGADYQRAQANMLGGEGGGAIGNIANAIRNKTMTPDQGFGAVSSRNGTALALANNLATSGTDAQGLQNAADKNTATAKYEGGPDVQGKVRTAQSITSDANVLKDLSANLKSSDWQIVNKYGLAIAAQKGSVPAQEILDQAKLVADRFQALVGGGSDAKLELGLNLFDAAKTPAQITRSVARVNESLANYASSLKGNGTSESKIAPSIKSGAGAIDPGAAAIIQSGLKAGKSREQIKASLKAAGH